MASGGEIVAICLLVPLLLLLFILLLNASDAREERQRQRVLNKPPSPKAAALRKISTVEQQRSNLQKYKGIINGIENEEARREFQQAADSALELLNYIQAAHEEELLEVNAQELRDQLKPLRDVLTGAVKKDVKAVLDLVEETKSTGENLLVTVLAREILVSSSLRDSYRTEESFRAYVQRRRDRGPLEFKDYVRFVSPRYLQLKDSIERVVAAMSRLEQAVAAQALLETAADVASQQHQRVDLAPHKILMELEVFIVLENARAEDERRNQQEVEQKKAMLHLRLQDLQSALRA